MRPKAAVVTISDSSSGGLRPDTSGPAVKARLESSHFEVTAMKLIPDDEPQIAATLTALLPQVDVIFTTGGTGITPRDVTPEATRRVIDREIPGLGELMRSYGRQFTPFSSLSRALAGTRDGVLIVNLPGSPKAAIQSIDAILELVPHVLDLINGRTGHAPQ